MKLIIDASNLRNGGGVTHIVEVLNSLKDELVLFERVEIFSNTSTLDKIVDRKWLKKLNHPDLNKGLLQILKWRFLFFRNYLKQQKNTILFNPPGTYIGNFRPFVVMSHNMLIWDKEERKRFGIFSALNFKFKLLNFIQKRSFNRASGIIFISHYAKNTILKRLRNDVSRKFKIIFHGINSRFVSRPKSQQGPPLDILYISNLTFYKHQIILLKAALLLYKEGFKFKLNLVGGYHKDYKAMFDNEFNSDALYSSFVTFHGKVEFEEIHSFYLKSNAFIFASSCENMPNILVEAMSSGLPILCSSNQPMPEFLGDDHEFYFDPTSVNSTYQGLKKFITSDHLKQSAELSFKKSQTYNWELCANNTFQFLFDTLEKYDNAKQ